VGVSLSKKNGLFLLITILIVFLDQATKAWVVASMNLHDSHAVIKGLFNITYIRNPGAAFGFLAGASPLFRYVFFIAVTVGAILLIIYYLRITKMEDLGLVSALALIFAGAVGNLIDRARFGEVVDFLDFYIGKYHWPAFNAADSAITIGAVIMAVIMFRRQHRRRRP
jgi:signal peptidase II